MEITIKNETFILHAFGGMYWKEKSALFIADLHIGKVNHFRKSGLAVPAMAKYANFDRLDQLTREFNPSSIYFLGDLFHSYKNEEWDAFVAWVEEEEAECHLIIGNHDIWDIGKLPTEFLKVHESYEVGPFLFTHEPLEEAHDQFNICGHIHPGIALKGKGRQRVKLPCFARYENQMILPSFGVFTGLHLLEPREMVGTYIPVGDTIVPLK